MDNIQAPQNGTGSATEVPSDKQLVTKTFEKLLFPTDIKSFQISDFEDFQQKLLTFIQSEECQPKDSLEPIDPIFKEDDSIFKLREIVYSICEQLPEFNIPELQYTPTIIGSQIFYQQQYEHIPPHAYEFVPLVFSFILSCPESPPVTYYPDTRGAVQTVRDTVSQNLVATSFSLRGWQGEVIVTPGYLQRYVETNLSERTYVVLNVKIGFASY
jgi:hypothetical protein